MFYFILTTHIKNTRFQFGNCWFIPIYDVIIHNKWSKCFPHEPLHVWPWKVTNFQRCRGCCKCLTSIRIVLVKCLFILGWSWIHYRFAVFPHIQIQRNEIGWTWGLYIEKCSLTYEDWNFNFGNTPLDWIQEMLEWRANAAGRMGPSPTYIRNGSGPSRNGHTQ